MNCRNIVLFYWFWILHQVLSFALVYTYTGRRKNLAETSYIRSLYWAPMYTVEDRNGGLGRDDTNMLRTILDQEAEMAYIFDGFHRKGWIFVLSAR